MNPSTQEVIEHGIHYGHEYEVHIRPELNGFRFVRLIVEGLPPVDISGAKLRSAAAGAATDGY